MNSSRSQAYDKHCTYKAREGRARYHVDLARLQSLCDTNYYRLQGLFPQRLLEEQGTLSPESRKLKLNLNGHVAQAEMKVQEQTRYTTLLSLTFTVPSQDWLPLPDLIVRMYHDVRMAEVISASHFRNLEGRYEYPNPAMHQPDEKHQLNKQLAQWLDHCLAAGYRSDSETERLMSGFSGNP